MGGIVLWSGHAGYWWGESNCRRWGSIFAAPQPSPTLVDRRRWEPTLSQIRRPGNKLAHGKLGDQGTFAAGGRPSNSRSWATSSARRFRLTTRDAGANVCSLVISGIEPQNRRRRHWRGRLQRRFFHPRRIGTALESGPAALVLRIGLAPQSGRAAVVHRKHRASATRKGR